MSLFGFQQALFELVMAPALCKELAELPPPELPPALASFELTERERRRLHAVARDRGTMMVQRLHRSTRLGMLSNTVPRTCEALGSRKFQEVVHRFWKEYPPTSVQYLREALRFGEFLRARLDSGEVVHELLPDLLEAELALLVLGKSGVAAPASPEVFPEGASLEEARPRLGPWCRVLPFRREPRAVLRAIGHVPATLPEGELFLVLVGLGPGRVSVHVVDAPRGCLLLASTGERSVARLRSELDCPTELLQDLSRRGFLQVNHP
jgi:hypothetical protein